MADEPEKFDELFVKDASVHLEMLDDGTLWMQFEPKDGESVTVVVTTKKGRPLVVRVERDA